MKPSTKNQAAVRRGRASKLKGKVFERAVVAAIRDWWPAARRGLGQARDSGEECDVEGTPFWIECKHRKQVDVKAAVRQAEEDSLAAHEQHGQYTRPPVVIWRVHGTRTIHVTLRLALLVQLTTGHRHLLDHNPLVQVTLDDWLGLFVKAGPEGSV